MADAAVEFLLENLKQLLLHHSRLIKDARSHLQILEKDLSLFKAFLEEHSTEKQKKNKALKELLRQIRDVIYEAEDIIDAFVTQAAKNKTRSYFTRIFRGQAELLSLNKKVEEIVPVVERIFEKSRMDFAALRIGSVSEAGMEHKEFKQNKVPRVREDNLVGFEDAAQTLISYLGEETEELDVISIIGMPGLGKTTLARKVFRDQNIQYKFPMRIWVSISQEYSKRDVFLAIMSNLITKYSRTDAFLDVLRNFINVREEDDNMTLKLKLESRTDDEFAQMLGQYLEKIKFLIVMDDIWTAEAWTDLGVAFPKFNKTGKILITSRNEEVARQANRNRDPYKPRLLTHEESWELLQLDVFGKPECHPHLEELGKTIAKQCGGLPLAIVVIGGILVKKASTRDITAMKNMWRKVSENLGTYINEDTRMENIIALSYNKLPYCLRPCFLYIGMFPEDFEIPASELSSMWMAEGLVQQKGGISLEETAQEYLEELISRNLVMVGKIGTGGKIKTCRIHDMLREFCQNEAGSEKENFFHQMKKSREGDFEPSITVIQKSRRLCIHTNVLSFISSEPFGPRVHSFLSLPDEEIPTHQCENISFIHAKLLRVFHVHRFMFTKFPNDLRQLLHLRHISLSGQIRILPRAISELWNLQTLIVFTSYLALEIKADIWKMSQLRHLKTNRVATLPKPGKSTEGCKKLQTLGFVSLKRCTDDMIDRLRSLRKLGVGSQIIDHLDTKGLAKLDNLEKLKLFYQSFYSYSNGDLKPFPPELLHKFPPKLRSLTLFRTGLDWIHISSLAMLDTLEILKLQSQAVVGLSWEMTDEVFRHLEILLIADSYLRSWTASAHHFPRLRCLVLQDCQELEEIPFGLGENLQQLELSIVSRSAAASAWKIEQAKLQKQQGETSRSSGFKLFIDRY